MLDSHPTAAASIATLQAKAAAEAAAQAQAEEEAQRRAAAEAAAAQAAKPVMVLPQGKVFGGRIRTQAPPQ